MDYTPSDLLWMGRCFDLARNGIGRVSPNPPVGAVLVYQHRILGEGYHSAFGAAHAEVEAIRSVKASDRVFIPHSTLYVSLEPCCITGKTPPCTNLILSSGIKEVRISTLDPNPAMAGKGVAILEQAGVSVVKGIREHEGKELISTFSVNILERRPYVFLKWAQSRFGITSAEGQQVWMSDPLTKVWSHGQRAATDAILVGSRTVMTDDPVLTVRDHPGRSPDRVIYDPHARLDMHYQVFAEDGCRVFYFSNQNNERITGSHVLQFALAPDASLPHQITQTLFEYGVGILLVEGGTYMHNLFLDAGLWDETWVIRTSHPLDKGKFAPDVTGKKIEEFSIGKDIVTGIARV